MAVSKGIEIEFRGNTTPLKNAINSIRKEAREFDNELRYIDNSLKFNPNNIKLTAQKMQVLKEAADDSGKRLDELKKALAEMEANGVDRTSAEYRELEREIVKTENKQKSYNSELKKMEAAASGLGKVSKSMEALGNKMTKAGEALKGISTVAAGIDVALAGLAYKAGDAADELNTMSKITGISTGELQKYKAAADLVDVSVETIASSQTKMKKSMLSAQQGSKNMADAFATLGINIEDSNGHLRSQDEVFQEAIESLGKMSNETERDALAMQIFGRSAAELNPLIEDNGETYKMVADIFRKNNLEIVDQETIDNANLFNDELDKIKATGAAAINSIGMQLAGYLAPAMEKISSLIQSIAGWLSGLDPAILTTIGIIAGVVAGLAPVLIILGKVAFAISSIMSLMSTIGPIIAGLAGPVGIAIAIIGALIAVGVLLYKNWDKVKAKATELKNWVVKTFNDIKTKVSGAIIQLKTQALLYWTALKTGVATIVDGLKSKVVAVFNAIKSTATTVWNAIKTAITNPINTAVTVVRTAINKIKGFFSGLKLKLPHIKLPHFKLTGSLSLVPPSVPKISVSWYKQGGIFTKPTLLNGMNGVGEAGAEAVLPLKKLWEEMDKRFSEPSDVVINVYAPQGMNVNELAEQVQRRLVQLQRQKAKAY